MVASRGLVLRATSLLLCLLMTPGLAWRGLALVGRAARPRTSRLAASARRTWAIAEDGRWVSSAAATARGANDVGWSGLSREARASSDASSVTDGAGARLAAAARETAAAAASPAAEAARARPVGDFTPGFHDQEEVGVHEVSDAAEARRVAALLCARDELIHACDTEVADLDLGRSPLGQGRVLCITVYSGPDLDVGSGPGKALFVDTTEPGVLEAFKPWLERESALKVWHNYGFDRHVLYNHGVDVVGFGGDTMHMARLWDASRLAGYSLAALTEELVGRAKVRQ